MTYDELTTLFTTYANQSYKEYGSYSRCAGAYEALLKLLILNEVTPQQVIEQVQSHITE